MSAVCTERHMPPKLNSYSEDFSGEGLYTHTTTVRESLILTGPMLWSRRLEPVVLKKQLSCRCQWYVRSVTQVGSDKTGFWVWSTGFGSTSYRTGFDPLFKAPGFWRRARPPHSRHLPTRTRWPYWPPFALCVGTSASGVEFAGRLERFYTFSSH